MALGKMSAESTSNRPAERRAPAETPTPISSSGEGGGSLDRSSDQQRKFVQPVQLYVFQRRGKSSTGQGNPVPVAGDSKGRLILLSQTSCKEVIAQRILGTGDTFICQASSDIDDIMIWINNPTAAQTKLSLNLRPQAAATAAGNALITTAFIEPNFYGPLPGLVSGMMGMKGKMSGNGGDILSGISSVASAIIVTVFGRRVQS